MATYLVTGGAGFIGSSIAEALLRAGDRVRIVDDFSTGRRENIASLPGKVELLEGDICDGALMTRAMQGIDAVFHEAALPSVSRSVTDPQESMRVNVQGTTVVLDAARLAGVKRVLFAASSSAYGDTEVLPKVESMPTDPLSPYAVSKISCEQLLKVFSNLYGIETLALRYFNVFGPRQDPTSQYAAVIPNFMTAAVRGMSPPVYGDGEQTRDFCFIENTVAANLLGLSTSKKLSGQVVNVACGERISLNRLLELVSKVSGHPVKADYQPARPGDIRDSLADINAARELLGYEPKVLVEEGLQRTYDYFKAIG